jgi:hypothetical protein
LPSGGTTTRIGLGQDDEAHHLGPRHAQGLAGLELAARDGDDAGPIDLREIGRIVHGKADHPRHEGIEADAEGRQDEVDVEELQQAGRAATTST